MAENLLGALLSVESVGNDSDFELKFNEIVSKFKDQCSLEEFAVYFLNFLRNQTEEFMKVNSSTCNTPCKPNHISEATSKDNQRTVQRDLFPTTPTAQSSISISNHINANDFIDLNDSFHKKSFDRCSTPLRSFDNNQSGSVNLRTPARSFSDRNNTSHNNASGNNTPNINNNNSFCLADFIVSNKTKQIKRRSRNQSTPTNNNSTSNCSSNSSTATNNSSKNTSNNVSTTIKPKRRVVPTTIQPSTTKSNQSNGHEFFTSSFKSDNNLLNVMVEEREPNSNHISRDRETLLEEKLNIKHEFDLQNDRSGTNCMQQINQILQKNIAKASPDKLAKQQSDAVNLSNISNKFYLDNLIKIYSHIINLNLITNILNELSYLLNLININVAQNDTRTLALNNNNNIDYKYNLLLKSINNCVYFSFGVLDRQKFTLSLLDTKTLKVLIENERMDSLNSDLYDYLRKLYQTKINLNYTSLENSNNNSSNVSNVFFQEETDTRNNYPSENEFRSFVKQRDLFYTILRKWEYQYSNPKSTINVRFDLKVVELISNQDHPVNMQHLSKLFVAQLILSCNFDDTLPELQNELPNIDLNKLSKLQQRLVAPSNFSTEYMFPGIQGFFKEFIVHGQFSNIFIEQLKLALIHELLVMNDDWAEEERFEDKIRPINISTMRVLAKFIGYIVSLPYKYDNRGNLGVDETQITFRNVALPQFDIRTVLIKAIKDNRILITIPWIVQYLTMLDHISIQLNYYKSVLKILYEIYVKLDQIAQNYHPTSKFIIHACLGWLFHEIPSISDEYYSFRSNFSISDGLKLGSKNNGTKNWELIEVIIPSKVQSMFVKSSLPVEMANFEFKNGNLTCIINNQSNLELNPLALCKSRNLDGTKSELLNVNLENLLNIACPFLADFRISIMPVNYTKSVSRSGKYRYIRTNLTDSKTQNKDNNSSKQQKLLDEFLQSQSQSTKKTIDFIIERTISAVIKDYQIEYLLPIKDETTKMVNNITGNSLAEVREKLLIHYADGLRELVQKWNDTVPGMIRERVTNSFNALLPKETLEVLKKTYIAFAVQKCIFKTNEWRTTHCSSMQFFTKDLKSDAEKLYQKIKFQPKSTEMTAQIPVTDLHLTLNTGGPIPSLVYSNLMTQLNRASRNPQQIVYDDLMKLFDELFIFMTQQILTADLYKTTGFLVIQLLQFLMCNLPMYCDDVLMNRFIDFMKISKFQPFLKFDDVSNDSAELQQEEEAADVSGGGGRPKRNTNYLFNAFLSGCLLELIKNSTNTSWHLLAQFIINLIDNQFYSLNLFNEQYLSLFKYDLSPLLLENLSILMDRVLKHFNRTAAGCDFDTQQTQLFSEMLTDLTREIDNL